MGYHTVAAALIMMRFSQVSFRSGWHECLYLDVHIFSATYRYLGFFDVINLNIEY